MPTKTTLQVAEEALDAAGVKNDGIDPSERVIYVDAQPSAALVLTPCANQEGEYVRIELNAWDASGGLDTELWVADVRPGQAGVVCKHWLEETAEEAWGDE